MPVKLFLVALVDVIASNFASLSYLPREVFISDRGKDCIGGRIDSICIEERPVMELTRLFLPLFNIIRLLLSLCKWKECVSDDEASDVMMLIVPRCVKV